MRYVASLTSIGFVLAVAALSASPARAAPSEACDTSTVQAMAPADTTVSFAARESGICRVSGYVTTRDPGPNHVLFTLALPDNFNGRYVYLGVGGAAGSLPVMQPNLLAKGYALAGSDGGTGAKTGADFSFQTDPAKQLDFSWRGVHVTAQATQQIARSYYKPKPDVALHQRLFGRRQHGARQCAALRKGRFRRLSGGCGRMAGIAHDGQLSSASNAICRRILKAGFHPS
jgi:hypothetical protein